MQRLAKTNFAGAAATQADTMGGALYFIKPWFAPFTHGSLLTTLPALAVLVGIGVAIYAVACFATGAFRPADIKALIGEGRD